MGIFIKYKIQECKLHPYDSSNTLLGLKHGNFIDVNTPNALQKLFFHLSSPEHKNDKEKQVSMVINFRLLLTSLGKN